MGLQGVKLSLWRPEAMEALKNMVNTSQTFYAKAANSTAVVDGFFTQEELDGEQELLIRRGLLLTQRSAL